MQDGENLEHLVKTISDIFRTKLGIGREISLVESYRLTSTRVEVNGCPPVLLSFEHQHDRDAVLAKASCLDKQAGIAVSTRCPRKYCSIICTRLQDNCCDRQYN